MSGLYIHIPFCQKKCNYCNFFSIENIKLIEDFLKAIEIEFSLRKNELPEYKTLYIGGGSPSVLNLNQLEILFQLIEKNFGKIKNFKESTIELNPESANKEKLDLIKSFGFNRLSIGLQSTNNKILKFLGRLATYEKFLEVYKTARKIGFENINLDLIYGIPGQKIIDLKKDLKKIIHLSPEHISLYCLEIYKNTKFGKMNLKQDENLQAKMYFEIINNLEKNNYKHYEISNFSKKGYQSLHNLNYWNRGYYSGFGPGASSHIENKRFTNSENLNEYISGAKKGFFPKKMEEILTPQDIENEKIILGLRKIDGIELEASLIIKLKDKIERLLEKGFIEKKGNRIKIKKEFLFVSNSIITEFL